ncbi:MAG: M14 family zinc carboxypeptidase [Promethearchaeati archaeon SRVP18_Atabeyarchaeia-1]
MGAVSNLSLVVIVTILLVPCFATVAATPISLPADDNTTNASSRPSVLSPLHVSSAPVPVDWGSYHDYTSLRNLLLSFNESYRGFAYVFSIGKTWQGRDILCIRITNESVANSSKQQILIVAEHHAREVITQEAALYLTWYLLANLQTDANIRKLLASKEIYIIPCLNPDGMQVALTYNPFQRKNMHPIDDDHDLLVDEDNITDANRDGFLECYEIDTNLGTASNPVWVTTDQAYEGIDANGNGVIPDFVGDNPGGVDLNRNYDFHFNDTFEMSSNSTNPRVEDYKGPAPFSEPETRAIKGLVESHRFIFAMSLHSGSETLLRPWSYTNDVVSLGANLSLFNMFGEAFQQASGYYYSLGSGGIGYNCSGEFCDWMYGAKGIPAMTCEMYVNYSAYQYYNISPSGDRYICWGIWDYFNPSNLLIDPVCRRGLGMLEEVCAINTYSSIRATSASQLPIIFNDRFNQLNFTWNFGGPSDIAVGSYTLLPSWLRSAQKLSLVSNTFSLLSGQTLTNLTLSVRYTDQQLNSTNTDENSLNVFMWDSQGQLWARLQPLQRDTSNNTIVVQLAPTIAGNAVYYFMLASYPSPSGPPYLPPIPLQAIIFSALAAGVAVGAIVATALSRVEKGSRSLKRPVGRTVIDSRQNS